MAFQQAQLGLVCIRVQCPSLPAASRRILPIIAAAKAAAPPSRLAERHAQKEAQRVEKERLQKQGRPEGKAPKSRKADTGSKADRDRLRKQRRAAPTKLSSRLAHSSGAQLCSEQWQHHEVPASNLFLEYIPGRDTLYTSEQLAAGLGAHDAQNGEHILQTHALPRGVPALVTPFVTRGVQLFQARQLPQVADGRASGGPLDLKPLLALPALQAQVQAALQGRAARLKAAGQEVPRRDKMLPHVVHVSPDQRKVFVGDERDATRSGTRLMSLPRAWRGNTLQTWAGGMRMREAAVEGQPPRLEPSHLSALLAAEEGGLVRAAESLWDLFAADPVTTEAAQRMQAHLRGSKIRQQSAIGRTGWNGYVFNVSYRTGPHVDGKNVEGSYSALVVAELGDPVAGGFYMLPQYRAALDLRQGVVMFHRSGDARLGLHGNSGMFVPHHQSYRVALVFYQTDLKVDDDEVASDDTDG